MNRAYVGRRGSSVGIITAEMGFDTRQRQKCFSSPLRPERHWVSHYLQSNVYQRQTGREPDRSPSSMAEVENVWTYNAVPDMF
jgi:hypothetical protein